MVQAADESNVPFLASALTFDALLAAVPFVLLLLIGLTFLAEHLTQAPQVDPAELFHSFLPPHAETGRAADPFAFVERLLASITENRGQLSLYAVPAFVWFSTRLFAGVRVSLNDVFDVGVRPAPTRNFVVGWVRDKLRDIGMVVATVILLVVNTVLSAGLALLNSSYVPVLEELEFIVGWLGRTAAELLAFGASVSLFYIVYKYASTRRLPWRSALLASTFTALGFELAKRLYGLYLANFASLTSAGGDANIGAALLFVLWLYYTALVFLIGGVVAETWELRQMQRRQRAILT